MDKMHRLHLEHVFRLEPVPAMRTRSDAAGRHYTPEKYRDYKKSLALSIRAANGFSGWNVPAPGTRERTLHLKTVRYALSLVVYRSRDVGDLDNYTKAVKDALGDAGVIANDKQIIDYLEPFGLRLDKADPRVEIKLWRISYGGQISDRYSNNRGIAGIPAS